MSTTEVECVDLTDCNLDMQGMLSPKQTILVAGFRSTSVLALRLLVGSYNIGIDAMVEMEQLFLSYWQYLVIWFCLEFTIEVSDIQLSITTKDKLSITIKSSLSIIIDQFMRPYQPDGSILSRSVTRYKNRGTTIFFNNINRYVMHLNNINRYVMHLQKTIKDKIHKTIPSF